MLTTNGQHDAEQQIVSVLAYRHTHPSLLRLTYEKEKEEKAEKENEE